MKSLTSKGMTYITHLNKHRTLPGLEYLDWNVQWNLNVVWSVKLNAKRNVEWNGMELEY